MLFAGPPFALPGFRERSMKRLFAVALAACLLCPSAWAQKVAICDDESEFPPYAYREPSKDNPGEMRVTGATVDLVKEIFKLLKLPYSYDLMPWKRCTAAVENFRGEDGYEMFVNGSNNEERAQKFYVSAPIFRRHTGLWFSRTRFPKGPPITKAKDLDAFRVCGAFGYNYDWLIALGVKKIDTGAASPQIALQKLSLDRCDFVVAGMEDTYIGQKLGRITIPDDVKGIPFPGSRRPTYHFFISKTSPRALELYTNINQVILQLQNSGKAQEIFRKYLPEGDGL
jgi:polar amino acid transport system substrate-binding protein